MPTDVQAQAAKTAKAERRSPRQPEHPIAKAARRLVQEAKGHMRLSNQHRQRASTLYAELDELVRECNARGIDVEIDLKASHSSDHQPPSDHQSPQGGTSGNNGSTPN